MITIHWDFKTGDELTFSEACEAKDDFCTNCLDFFTTERDAIVLKENGEYISVKELLANDGNYTRKEIRPAHNIHKMLKAGSFTWNSPKTPN